MTLIHKKLINGEGIDLNLHNNLILVYSSFPGHLPKTGLSHPLLSLF